MGALSMIVALSLNGVRSALDAYWALASIFIGSMLRLFLLAYLGKRVSRTYAIDGVVLGVIVIAWMSLSPILLKGTAWAIPFHADLTIVFGALVILLQDFCLPRASEMFTAEALSPAFAEAAPRRQAQRERKVI